MTATNSQTERDFSDSFLWRVQLRADRPHLWKHHARVGTLMREVLGLLDKWARNDPQRFVPASLAAILKNCNKGKRSEGKSYTLRHLKFVMAELRARHIISPYFTTWDGRDGFVMEPHELRTCLLDDGKVCQKRAPKRFECSDEVAEKLTGCSPLSSPPVHHLFTDLFTTCSPTSSPTGSQKFTDQFTERFTSELSKVYKNAELTEALCKSWFADGEHDGFPIRINRLSVEPYSRKTAVTTAAKPEQEQEPPQNLEGRVGVVLPGVNEETQQPCGEESIGLHFGELATLELITDGELNTDTAAWQEFKGAADLHSACWDVINDFAAEPYVGRKTNQRVMDAAAKRFGKVPRSWVKVMYTLRDSAGAAKVKSAASEAAEEWQKEIERMRRAFGVVPDGTGGWKKP